MKEPATEHRNLQELGRIVRQGGLYTSIPMVLLGGPVAGFLIGRFLDQRLDSDPWGVALAVGIGFIAGSVQTIRIIQRAQRESNHSERPGSDGERP